jgi:hypothetical protein
MTVRGFLAYASTDEAPITSTIWTRISRGSKLAAKNVPDLRQTVERINDAIAADLERNGLKGVWHPGMVAKMVDTLDGRTQALVQAIEAEEGERETPATTPTTSEDHLAIHVHPDDPSPLGEDGVWPRPLYSRAQLEAGIPYIEPSRFKAK